MDERRIIAVVTAVILALLPAACKINKETNCLNPKAACYQKDTEPPTIVTTTPSNPPAAVVLSTLRFSFSEPMKNAGERSAYINPVGAGSNLVIDTVTKINDQTFELSLSGPIGNGGVVFDLSMLTDLAGNVLSPGQFTIQTSSLGAVPDTVTSIAGAYNQTNISWTNTTPYAMTYIIKIGGTDCGVSSTAAAGGFVAGTVAPGGPIVTNLGWNQFAISLTNTVRICLTPVATGTATAFTVNVGRIEIVPTINNLASGRVKIPYLINSLVCDNVDRIVYTIDGTSPSFTVTSTGGSVGAVAGGTSLAYSLVSGYTLNARGSVPFRYLCIDKSGQLNTGGVKLATLQSKFVWDESNWAPVAPNDVWD